MSNAVTRISQARDIFKNALLGMIEQSNYIDNAVLSANTGLYVTLPSLPSGVTDNQNLIVVIAVSGGSNLYIQFQTAGNGAAISVPSGNGTFTGHTGTGAGVELVSSCARTAPKGSVYLSMISPVACNVTLAYYFAEVRM